MVRYLFYTIGDLTYQSPLVILLVLICVQFILLILALCSIDGFVCGVNTLKIPVWSDLCRSCQQFLHQKCLVCTWMQGLPEISTVQSIFLIHFCWCMEKEVLLREKHGSLKQLFVNWQKIFCAGWAYYLKSAVWKQQSLKVDIIIIIIIIIMCSRQQYSLRFTDTKYLTNILKKTWIHTYVHAHTHTHTHTHTP